MLINTWLKEKLSALLKCKPESVYNADEIGLYIRVTPSRSLCFAEDKLSGGKNSKECT